jgi:hypothetical protein
MATNTLGLYDPYFYANEAIAALQKRLGMANAVHRGYDRNPQEKGSVIQIRKPSVFTAADMPGTDQDLTPGQVSITLDQWKGVTFGLTDKELTLAESAIISDHIVPAAYAVADAIDLSLAALYKDVPWVYAADAAGAVTDFTGSREIMFNNMVPESMRSLMLNGEREAKYTGLAIFHQANTSSDGAATQREGSLGRKFGFDIFANQNVQNHTAGTISTSTLAVVGNTAAGVSAIALDAVAVTGTLKPGDTFVIAGDTQRYAVTALATAAGNAFASVAFTPALASAAADNAVVTVTATSKAENLAFHQSAFALAMAPLSDMGHNLGARIATVTDPRTSLTLRSRVWYEGGNAKVRVSIDALWGVKTLDGNRAVRLRS